MCSMQEFVWRNPKQSWMIRYLSVLTLFQICLQKIANKKKGKKQPQPSSDDESDEEMPSSDEGIVEAPQVKTKKVSKLTKKNKKPVPASEDDEEDSDDEWYSWSSFFNLSIF